MYDKRLGKRERNAVKSARKAAKQFNGIETQRALVASTITTKVNVNTTTKAGAGR